MGYRKDTEGEEGKGGGAGGGAVRGKGGDRRRCRERGEDGKWSSERMIPTLCVRACVRVCVCVPVHTCIIHTGTCSHTNTHTSPCSPLSLSGRFPGPHPTHPHVPQQYQHRRGHPLHHPTVPLPHLTAGFRYCRGSTHNSLAFAVAVRSIVCIGISVAGGEVRIDD